MHKMNWGTVQTVCLIGFFVIVNFSLRPGPSIPKERLPQVWAFRLIVGGLCLGGAIVAGIMQQRQKAAQGPIESGVPSLSPGTRAISVTYRNTREDAKRCELFTLFNRPVFQVFFGLFGAAIAMFATEQLAKLGLRRPLLAFPVLHFLSTSLLFGYMALLLPVVVKGKFPTPDSVRVCTTSLTAEGFQDVTPDKIISIAWKDLRRIDEANGDIYFCRALSSCYVPRSAFSSREEARRFHRAAVCLWKSRGKDWPEDVPEVAGDTETQAETPKAPVTFPNDNPYAAPRAALWAEYATDGSPTYASWLRRCFVVVGLEYVALIGLVVMR